MKTATSILRPLTLATVFLFVFGTLRCFPANIVIGAGIGYSAALSTPQYDRDLWELLNAKNEVVFGLFGRDSLREEYQRVG